MGYYASIQILSTKRLVFGLTLLDHKLFNRFAIQLRLVGHAGGQVVVLCSNSLA
jgi:hypothetical protein